MIAPTELELRSLYNAAIKFKNLKPWELILENQLFIVMDPETNIEGYCCIMGTKGDHLALSVYLGEEGLKSYLKMYDLEDSNLWHPSYMKTMLGQQCLMVSFEDRSQLSPDERLQLNKLGYYFTGKNAWPKINEHMPGFMPVPLSEGWQCRFLCQAIEQACEITRLSRVNAIVIPDWSKDQFVCRYFDETESWKTTIKSTGIMPTLKQNFKQYENELMAYKIKKLSKRHVVLEGIQFLLADPVQRAPEDRPFFPLITALVDHEGGEVVFAEMTDSTVQSQEEVLEKLAKFIAVELQFKPKEILINDDDLNTYWKDFCQKVQIDLKVDDKIEFAYEFMNHVLDRSDDEIDNLEGHEEIDLMISTTRQICDIIINSESICKNFSENVKSNFSNVIELLHVIMVSNFNEFPEWWSPANFETACANILPSLLGTDEMKDVFTIINEYLYIAGQSNIMPNYKLLQQILKKVYIQLNPGRESLDIHKDLLLT